MGRFKFLGKVTSNCERETQIKMEEIVIKIKRIITEVRE